MIIPKSQTRPAFQVSVVRLQCLGCGAEANASCDCGKPYVPARERAAEAIAAHPEKSNRAIAEEIGVGEPTVRRARNEAASPDAPETVTGRDGKTYPATKPKRPSNYEPEPGEDDLIDFIVDNFLRLSFQGQTRCTARLRDVVQGKAS